ncbi:MAG: right-handed parallel beta-helix repeat-containing protein, partial [Acidobacteriota bacterium]
DLDEGGNADLVPLGLNQLFRGANRLPMGRWPNFEGHPDGGYAEVDSQPSADQIHDTELPAVNWSGAVMHIKGIRWYMLNRIVAADSGSTLTLTEDVQCPYTGDCAQWGYFLNNHLATLDREGEWYWDETTNRIYLYTATGPPSGGEITGSPITPTEGTLWGGVVLGTNLAEHIAHVTIDNLRIERWFDAGITTPINYEADELHDVTIRNCHIQDVDTTGIRLTTWVWNAAANGNGPNGWRGGRNIHVEGNVIDGANHFGLDTYGQQSQVLSNEIRNIALIENLGRSGMGCGFSGTNCTENGAGIRIKFSDSAPNHTAFANVVRHNRLAKIGMNGIDSFGRNITIENNVIDQACISKGDCGAIRTFGRTNLAQTPVHDVTIRGNIIRDTLGNTDGCHPSFETLFSLAIYIDNYSRDVIVENNTVTGSTWTGALFQRSTGQFDGNTLYDNVASSWGSELSLVLSGTSVTQSGNVLFPLGPNRRSLRVSSLANLSSSDDNVFMSPYDDTSIVDDSAGGEMTLADWQSHSGEDGSSTSHWYTQAPGSEPLSRIFINDTGSALDMDTSDAVWADLDQQLVGSSLNLSPYSSQVLIDVSDPLFADGFEGGDAAQWSSATP